MTDPFAAPPAGAGAGSFGRTPLRPRPPRPGSVTAAGVIAIVLGVAATVLGVFGLLELLYDVGTGQAGDEARQLIVVVVVLFYGTAYTASGARLMAGSRGGGVCVAGFALLTLLGAALSLVAGDSDRVVVPGCVAVTVLALLAGAPARAWLWSPGAGPNG